MENVAIRFADPAQDAPRILEVYRPYIEKTAVTFEIAEPTVEEFTQRVAGIASAFPYLLLEADGELIGYAYAHRQAEREAYRFNAELSIYLKEGLPRPRPGQAALQPAYAPAGHAGLYQFLCADHGL